MLLFIIYLDL